MAARDENFLDDGSVDPFTGLAPGEDPVAVAAARRAQLQRYANTTANINAAPGDYANSRVVPDTVGTAPAKGYLDRPDPHNKFSAIMGGGLDLVKEHPWVVGMPLAPLAMAALAPAAAGAGTLSGAESVVPVANEATGLATAGPGFSAADAASFNGAGAAFPGSLGTGAAGTAGAAGAAGAAPGAAGLPWGEIAGKTLATAAPVAINMAMGGRTKEEKALIAKQQQLAQEARVRQGQQQDARMNALGQQLLAFNPSNQLMAQMYGPQAAFGPEQMAQMVQGPKPNWDEQLYNYTGTDQNRLKAKAEMIRRKNEYDASEGQRRDMMMNGISQPGPGPAPINMPAPQAARRY